MDDVNIAHLFTELTYCSPPTGGCSGSDIRRTVTAAGIHHDTDCLHHHEVPLTFQTAGLTTWLDRTLRELTDLVFIASISLYMVLYPYTENRSRCNSQYTLRLLPRCYTLLLTSLDASGLLHRPLLPIFQRPVTAYGYLVT